MGRNGKSIPLYMHIHRNLREEILSGKYLPGTILPSENTLCGQYNTSRYTVRSSLKKLESEGLVRNLPGRGWQAIKTDGKTFKIKNRVLSFIGRGDNESAFAFEAIRKACSPMFSDIKYHMKSVYRGPDWHDDFIEAEIDSGKTGAVIIFDDTPLPEKFVNSIKSAKIPLVCMPLNGSFQYDNIGTDNIAASEIMLNYLFERGHRNIIFVTSGELDKIPSFSLRRTGYTISMEKNGLKPEIIVANHNYWQGEDEEKMIMDKISSMKSENRGPSCIFCSTSTPVIEFLAILKRNSIRVPEDISICSFGCSRETLPIASKFGITSWTHIEEQFDLMGTVAVEILSMKSETSMPVSTLIPVKLIEGNSVIRLKQPISD